MLINNYVVCNCSGLGNTMPHADAVAQITANDQSWVVFLYRSNGLKATTAVCSVLRNGPTVA